MGPLMFLNIWLTTCNWDFFSWKGLGTPTLGTDFLHHQMPCVHIKFSHTRHRSHFSSDIDQLGFALKQLIYAAVISFLGCFKQNPCGRVYPSFEKHGDNNL